MKVKRIESYHIDMTDKEYYALRMLAQCAHREELARIVERTGFTEAQCTELTDDLFRALNDLDRKEEI